MDLWRWTRFKRLSASLHVKVDGDYAVQVRLQFQTPFGITACERRLILRDRIREYRSFKRLSASLHVKVRLCRRAKSSTSFQTPFGITACESGQDVAVTHASFAFQTPFGITACESRCRNTSQTLRTSFKRLSASLHVKVFPKAAHNPAHLTVSNAFRHHCM